MPKLGDAEDRKMSGEEWIQPGSFTLYKENLQAQCRESVWRGASKAGAERVIRELLQKSREVLTI